MDDEVRVASLGAQAQGVRAAPTAAVPETECDAFHWNGVVPFADLDVPHWFRSDAWSPDLSDIDPNNVEE